MITNIRYVAVLAEKVDEVAQVWKDLFGLEPLNEAAENQFGMRAVMLGVNGQPVVEVMQPARPNSAVARMMDEKKGPRNPRGEGVYMISVEVDDLEATIRQIESKGGRVTREEGNRQVAWVHPLTLRQVFVELSQRK